MALQLVELLFNNSPSAHNKELTDFLKRNLDMLILRGKIKFHFRIISKEEFANLNKQGITRLPAMLIAGKPHIGVQIIVSELMRRVKTSKTNVLPKSEDEVIDEYLKKEIGNIKYNSEGAILVEQLEQDDNDDGGAMLNEQALREVERRKQEQESQKSKRRMGNVEPPPSKPNRNMEYDDDYDIRKPQSIAATPQRQVRPDNIQAGDPIAALRMMQSKGQTSPDDDMMEKLLGRLTSDD